MNQSKDNIVNSIEPTLNMNVDLVSKGAIQKQFLARKLNILSLEDKKYNN